MSGHTCHWAGCARDVPPKMWGCRQHWYQLPAELRARIWHTYRPGQEISKTPSREYINAAKAMQDWIDRHHPPTPPQIGLLPG